MYLGRSLRLGLSTGRFSPPTAFASIIASRPIDVRDTQRRGMVKDIYKAKMHAVLDFYQRKRKEEGGDCDMTNMSAEMELEYEQLKENKKRDRKERREPRGTSFGSKSETGRRLLQDSDGERKSGTSDAERHGRESDPESLLNFLKNKRLEKQAGDLEDSQPSGLLQRTPPGQREIIEQQEKERMEKEKSLREEDEESSVGQAEVEEKGLMEMTAEEHEEAVSRWLASHPWLPLPGPEIANALSSTPTSAQERQRRLNWQTDGLSLMKQHADKLVTDWWTAQSDSSDAQVSKNRFTGLLNADNGGGEEEIADQARKVILQPSTLFYKGFEQDLLDIVRIQAKIDSQELTLVVAGMYCELVGRIKERLGEQAAIEFFVQRLVNQDPDAAVSHMIESVSPRNRLLDWLEQHEKDFLDEGGLEYVAEKKEDRVRVKVVIGEEHIGFGEAKDQDGAICAAAHDALCQRMVKKSRGVSHDLQ